MPREESGPQPAMPETDGRLWELAVWIAVRQTAPRQLSHGAKLCWDVIARFERTGLECWAGLMRMANEVGVTESQASRYIVELVRAKYVQRTAGKKGKLIYQRQTPPDLMVRAEKIYQELSVRGKDRGEQ
jgi:hypothetical protein